MSRKHFVLWAMVLAIGVSGIRVQASCDETDESYIIEEENDSEISAYTTYISSVYTSLEINSNNVASIYCKVQGGSSVTKTSISAVLQKKNGTSWTTVATWNTSSASSSTALNKTKSVSSGTYRVKATYKAYKGSECETMVKYSLTKTAS